MPRRQAARAAQEGSFTTHNDPVKPLNPIAELKELARHHYRDGSLTAAVLRERREELLRRLARHYRTRHQCPTISRAIVRRSVAELRALGSRDAAP